MADVLAVVEQQDGSLRGVSAEVVSAARSLADGLGGQVHALVIGGPGQGASAASLGAYGADQIHRVEADGLGTYQGGAAAQAVADVAGNGSYGAILFAATSQGRDLAPRVSAKLDVPLCTDVTGLSVADGAVEALRPVYAGKALARFRSSGSTLACTIRPNVFPAVENARDGAESTTTAEVASSGYTVRSFEASAGASVDVAEASSVVSGGRGMKGPENWNLLEDLRDALGEGAALGASRAVVDAGWRPHGEQVGQTGKTVAPKLYFAAGISGAIQHLAGMKTSGVIVAINKDADAPIFGVADYGIVGDVMDVLPKLSEEIRTLKQG